MQEFLDLAPDFFLEVVHEVVTDGEL